MTAGAAVRTGAQPFGSAVEPGRGSLALGWAIHGAELLAAAAAVTIDRAVRRRVRTEIPVGALVAIGGFQAGLAVAEWLRPYRVDWQPDRAQVVNDIAIQLIALPPDQLGRTLGRRAAEQLGRPARLDRFPVPVGAAIALLAFDLFHSQYHRLGHRWGPGWRVHSVHHGVDRLYGFNAGRNHPIEVLLDAIAEGAIVHLTGMSRDQQTAYTTFRGTHGAVEHCNLDVRSGILSRVFSTPDIHRWHHSTDHRQGDNNYGVITSIWDQLFGTWYRPDREFDAQLGIGRMPEFPQRVGELLLTPFRWGSIREANATTWYAASGS